MSRKKTQIVQNQQFIDFANRFKSICDGKNKNRIAEAIGVSEETIYDWFRGNRLPEGISLKKIKEYFDISLDWLLTGEESPACSFCSGFDAEIKEACRDLDDISKSGDILVKSAILLNIKAFKDSIKRKAQIDKLENDVRELKKPKLAEPSELHPKKKNIKGLGM